MASHFLSTKQNVGAAGAPEQIRREWQAFQVWYIAMRDEEGKSRELHDELAKRTERRNNTRQWLSNALPAIQNERETTRKLLLEGHVASRAQEEWQKRLDKIGLRMEQWTNITVVENAAVAAALWGGTTTEETGNFTSSESSDEIETDFDSESVTHSTSSRGPQLWTPPEISRTSNLPLPNMYAIPGSSDGVTKGGDKKPTAPRGPPIPTQRPNLRRDTNKPVPPMRSTKEPAEEQLTQKNLSPALEALQTDDAESEAWLKVHAPHAPTRLEEDQNSVQSWSDDRTLLATSTDVADDEFYEPDEEANRATSTYQKNYTQWIPAQQTGATKPNANIQSNPLLRSDTNIVQPPAQIKASNQPDASKASEKTYPIQSYTPATQPTTIAPNVQEPQADRKSALRKQIEEILMPLVIEAREDLQRKLTQADAVSSDKFTKEHNDTLKNICRIADKLYREQIEHEHQKLKTVPMEHGSPESITKQQSTSDPMRHQQQKELEGSSPKGRSSSEEQDPSPRASNATKSPSPLTPPLTPQPGTRYIGPALTDEEMKDEAAAFDDFTLAARKQKISEFHREAEILEFDLVEQFHTQKFGKKATLEMLQQHDEAMGELRKIKEQERKDMCVAERKRRMAKIAGRVREKEPDGQHDIPAQSNQKQRSDYFQQKRKEDEMVTQTRWRLATADTSGVPENSRGQTSAGQATNTQNHIAASGPHSSGSAKDNFSGIRVRADHPPTEKAEGSSGLLFVDSVDRRRKAPRLDEASSRTSDVNRITPLSPTVHLPKLYSDPEDDDTEFLTPNPSAKIDKRVRFRLRVQMDDSDVDSSDTDRPISNSLAPETGSRRQWTVPHEFDNGEGTSRAPTVRSRKTAMVELKQARSERNTDIWHPPTEKEGKGKEREVLLVYSQQDSWRS